MPTGAQIEPVLGCFVTSGCSVGAGSTGGAWRGASALVVGVLEDDGVLLVVLKLEEDAGKESSPPLHVARKSGTANTIGRNFFIGLSFAESGVEVLRTSAAVRR